MLRALCWILPHTEWKPKSPQCAWEDLPDLTAQSPPSSPLAISVPACHSQPFLQPHWKHAPTAGHLIAPFPLPASVFPQKSAWLTYSWPPLRLPRSHLIRENFPDYEIKMVLPWPSLRSCGANSLAAVFPTLRTVPRKRCLRTSYFFEWKFTISWKGHLPKCDSTFHMRARYGQWLWSALFYLLKAWTPQIQSVNYNIELWVLPNLITWSYWCSCPKGIYPSMRYIVYRKIQDRATENHCKVVLKWTKLISLCSLLYHPFVELSFMLCYLPLQFKWPIVLDIVESCFFLSS